jgi:hypothetical protein
MMQAALCRHADIDPHDGDHPYQEERVRLHQLAEFLRADPVIPPTAILDSGNGIQPLWAVVREPLTPKIIERIEGENRQIEAAVGAAGTHNIDRLLRLPGTLNFPNAKKQKLCRGITRARLLHHTDAVYTAEQAAGLGAHLKELLAKTGLVRFPAEPEKDVETKAKKKRRTKRDRIDRSALALGKGAALRRQGKTFEEMCAALHDDLETAEWYKEKGEAAGKRELYRIWDKAGEATSEIDRTVAEFNTKFMVVNEAGKAVIYAPAEDPILHRRYFDRLSAGDFRLLFLNRRVEVGLTEEGNPIMRPVADIWLQHAKRRQFIGGVTFDPSGAPTPPDVLNLWNGFAVQPRPGSWGKLRVHIRDVVCAGNREQYEYVIRWMARMVQHPAEQGEVAIVMRGSEGCGKGTLAKVLKRILGQHALAISNAKHLTGNFNAHLRDCVFLFADEAFFAGDRQHVGVLKSLITEPYLTVEGKYQNAVQCPNFLNVMMASNEEWVVPASLEARRFCVLEVLDIHKNDQAWFAAIWAEMDAGGYEAMLHDLLRYNLTNFNVRRVPATEGLQRQKKLSLDTNHSWWLDVVYRGYVFRSKLGLEEHFGQWHEEASTELLYTSYVEFAERKHERHLLSREQFGRFMISLGCSPKRLFNAVIGEHIADIQTDYGTTRKAEPILQSRPPGYRLGTLTTARAAFTAATRLEVEWPLTDEEDEAV